MSAPRPPLAASRISARSSAKPQAEITHASRLLALPVLLLVLVCSGFPLAWMIVQIATNPTVLVEAKLDAFRAGLLGRTLFYNGTAALVATLLGLPAALVIGRGRGFFPKLLWLALPLSLLLPSIVYAYGWSQFFRMTRGTGQLFAMLGLHLTFAPGSIEDVARCIWSLATWLWPIPAAVAGVALRQVDAQVQQQALLDGVLWRVTLRQLLGPLAAGAAIAAVLAMQEFAVYEPTGISVVATEVRMVFETGAFASPDNPITAPMGGGEGSGFGVQGSESAEAKTGTGTVSSSSPEPRALNLEPFPADQRARAAAAVAASLPLLGVIALLSLLAWVLIRHHHTSDAIDPGPWPSSLDAPWWAVVASAGVLLVAVATPLVSLVLALRVRFDPVRVFDEFAPQLSGSLVIAGATAALVMGAAMWSCVRRPSGATLLALATFLIGGQLLAIALIRIYNRSWLSDVYNGPAVVVMAYVGRFGWIALAAAGATWGRSWRELRDLAAVDGAGLFQTARGVIWPLAWPLLGGSAVLVGILSLTEVPATVLLAPQRPPMLTPLLMTWVHMLRYDAMIEGSLLLVGIVFALTLIGAALTWFGLRKFTPVSKLKAKTRFVGAKRSGSCISRCAGTLLRDRRGDGHGYVLLLALLAILPGCGKGSQPDAVWCEPGTGPVQLVYPRAIGYDAKGDTFYVIDRLARVQQLDRTGKPLNEWRMPEQAAGKPVGVSIGPDGNVYVPDTHYHRVIVYTPGGEEVRRWGSQGHGPGQFIYPTDIDFDAQGNVFVAEYGDNDRVQVFTPDGKYLYQFGKFGQGDGEFMRPQSILIDRATNLVYITDHANHRINVFRTDGTFVKNMGGRGSGLGEYRFPYGLAQDSRGRLIVCEFGNNRVQLIDAKTGAGLKTWGLGGHDPGQLAYPCGVAVDNDDRVVAVDAGNNRLQVFEF